MALCRKLEQMSHVKSEFYSFSCRGGFKVPGWLVYKALLIPQVPTQSNTMLKNRTSDKTPGFFLSRPTLGPTKKSQVTALAASMSRITPRA